ncbi:MAG: VOC family protein [Flavobacteriales bacterium]|nr:VOC family protein [Flavobacteriales bacterium]
MINFEKLGFKVEYGSKHNPHNALIYFSEGPYIELLSQAPVPSYVHFLLNILGKRPVARRFQRWKNTPEGFFGLCLENYEKDFTKEEEILSFYKQKYFITKSTRTDPSNRNLKWKLLFPYNLQLPFLMTYFNIDPKPKDFVHPNGVKEISSISFGTDASLIPIINELCDDDVLELHVGDGVKSLTYGEHSH